jgi:hypothetical protein
MHICLTTHRSSSAHLLRDILQNNSSDNASSSDLCPPPQPFFSAKCVNLNEPYYYWLVNGSAILDEGQEANVTSPVRVDGNLTLVSNSLLSITVSTEGRGQVNVTNCAVLLQGANLQLVFLRPPAYLEDILVVQSICFEGELYAHTDHLPSVFRPLLVHRPLTRIAARRSSIWPCTRTQSARSCSWRGRCGWCAGIRTTW